MTEYKNRQGELFIWLAIQKHTTLIQMQIYYIYILDYMRFLHK